MLVTRQSFKQRFGWKSECECDILGKRQVSRERTEGAKVLPKGQAKANGNPKTERGFRAAGPPIPFEEESWEETNETEQEKWWNSWTEDVEQKRDEAVFGAFMVGGMELELNSFKTSSGEILPGEGQLMWPCFSHDGRRCWLRGHVTDVHKPLISGKWRFDLFLELTHRKFVFKSND